MSTKEFGKPHLLHLFTAQSNASPFDVNMAYDAGYHAVSTYANVAVADIAGLTQDAIFSRGPKGVSRTGIMIGGRDLETAIDSFEAARKAMVPPFEVSVFVDPSGAFTTAAAMVAKVAHTLQTKFSKSLADVSVVVPGGTGPVGLVACVLAAQAGARVTLLSSSSMQRALDAQSLCQRRYGVQVQALHAASDEQLLHALKDANVILAAAKAGVEVVSAKAIAEAAALMVAADVNAVPPAGIAGLDVMADGKPLASSNSGALGIGALAIGNVKYQVEHGLFKQMLASDKALYIDFREAFALAESLSRG